ncbi:MAG TPA: hypothetical protein VIM51_08930 [Desulfosporosinus sp.]
MNILFSEMVPNFLIQGFGLHQGENQTYIGKVGRQEVQLLPSLDDLQTFEKDTKIFNVGLAPTSHNFRPGDVLMTGSDDLLDRAFNAMDDIEQRAVVVSLVSAQDSTHLYLSKDLMGPYVQDWKSRKVSFLCMWMVEPIELEEQAKFVTILRKVILKE